MMESLDVECPICLSILIKPVGPLPCHHEFCLSCFEEHINSSVSRFFCPICRHRISSWALQAKREGKLVNESRWDFIQKRFPKRVYRRLNNLDSDSEDEETSKLNSTVDLTVDDVEDDSTTVPSTSEAHRTIGKPSKRNIIYTCYGSGENTRRRADRGGDGRVTRQQQEDSDYRYALRLHKQLNKGVLTSEQSAAAAPGPAPVVRSPYLLRTRRTQK